MDIKSIVNSMTRDQKVRLCTGLNSWQTTPFEELGVPSLLMSDGTNGVRFQRGSTEVDRTGNLYDALINFNFDSELALSNTYPATCFPSGAALACSWSPQLAREVGAAVAKECKQLGIGLLLGPGMNIRRHPLTARNFEYYSEDPVLSGEMAAGMVNGIQGEGVGATLKHFVCNNSDTRRTRLDCLVEQRALREIYLAGFERALKKAHPAAVMGSYPAVNGDNCCENRWLLTDVLRGEWGFEGITVSDWAGVKNSAKAVDAGLDLQMPHSNQYIEQVNQALDEGSLDEAVLDAACERMLNLVFKYSREGKQAQPVDWAEQHALARRAAAECAVLLKNEKEILPLDAEKPLRIAVLGEAAVKPVYQGTGCAVVNAKQIDIPLDELREAMPKAEIRYAAGYRSDYTTTPELLQEAAEAAAWAEVAIVVAASRLPGESDDYDRPDMDLESGHVQLIEAVCATQPNTVVVVCNGEVVAMPWAQQAAAVLDMWYSGQGSGRAMAELLCGRANPGGKLSATVPHRLADTPAWLDFPHEQDTDRYREGVFVGYRWYDARQLEPLYPFGYGLSYTTFRYDAMQVTPEADGYKVEVTLTNTGSRAGSEVVQLYVVPAQAQVFRPLRELKAFARVSLQPGESKTVTLALERRDFAWYDDVSGDWRVNGGTWHLMAGGSSRELPLSKALELVGDAAPVRRLTADSHYTDLFASPKVAKVYFDFLVENGLLLPQQVSPHLEQELSKTFWGFSQHLDMLTGERLTQAKLKDLLERMNAALELDEKS